MLEPLLDAQLGASTNPVHTSGTKNHRSFITKSARPEVNPGVKSSF
jgi:hypothetical protein